MNTIPTTFASKDAYSSGRTAAALRPVQVAYELHIDGQPVSPVFSIRAEQCIGEHEELTLELPVSAIAGSSILQKDMLMPDELQRRLLGKVAIVIIKDQVNTDAPRFEGKYVLTTVSLEHHFGAEATLILKGLSATITLDGAPHFESFKDKSLKNIVTTVATEALEQYSGRLVCNPTFNEPVSYSSCFGESSWAYLKRLAAVTGQWLYYSGQELVFGAPGGSSRSRATALHLAYGGNCHRLSLRATTGPVQAALLGYQSADNNVLSGAAGGDSNNSSAGTHAALAYQRSKMLQQARPAHSYTGSLPAEKGMVDVLGAAKAASAMAGLYTVSGASSVFSMRLGSVVQVSLGRVGIDEKVEEHAPMRLTRIKHHLDCGKMVYENSFDGISASAEAPPLIAYEQPATYPLLAEVTDNNDPLEQGRVMVQFTGWVQGHSQQETGWIRVLTPDGGGSGDVSQNRGQVWVPETGDQVIVDFESGNPDRPFVVGSVHHGGNAGGQSNMIRSIMTKSGHTIELDDSAGGTSITISDKSGNTIHLDTRGSNITITAPENMTLNAKNIIVNAAENISMGAGMNISQAAGLDIVQSAGDCLSQYAVNDYKGCGDEYYECCQ